MFEKACWAIPVTSSVSATEATLVMENLNPEAYKKIKEGADEMAKYAACCYKPLLEKLNEHEKSSNLDKDIELLANIGAKRVINHFKKGQINFSPNERIIDALLKGKGDAKLSYSPPHSKHWSVHGFFLQGAILPGDDPHVFFPDMKSAKPKLYHNTYRYASFFEIETHTYRKVKKEEVDKNQPAPSEEKCLVM